MIGETLNNKKYLIMKRIGGGDKSALYQAKDQQSNAIVTLSQFSYGKSSYQPGGEQFRQVTAGLMGLNHTNIQAFSDFFVEDDYLYAVSPAINGNLLTDLLKQGAPPVEESVDIIRQVLTGLNYLHGKKVQHLDLKPDSICVSADGTKVTILNAGISKLLEGIHSDSETVVVGSGEYVAPEQIEPDLFQEPELGVTDIYAVGMVFYHLIAGEPAFQGSTHLEVLMKQLKDAPPLLYLKDDSFRAFDTLLGKALAKQPEKRYPNCTEFSNALNQAVTGWQQAAESSAGAAAAEQRTESTMRLPMDFVNEVTQTPEPKRRPAAGPAPGVGDKTQVMNNPPLPTPPPKAKKPEPLPAAEAPPAAPKRAETPKPAQPKKEEEKSGGGLPIIPIVALVALLLIGGLIFLFVGGGDDTPADTTGNVADTQTTEPTPPPATEPGQGQAAFVEFDLDEPSAEGVVGEPVRLTWNPGSLAGDTEFKVSVDPDDGVITEPGDDNSLELTFDTAGTKYVKVEAYENGLKVGGSNEIEVQIGGGEAAVAKNEPAVTRPEPKPEPKPAASTAKTEPKPAAVAKTEPKPTPKPAATVAKNEPKPAAQPKQEPPKPKPEPKQTETRVAANQPPVQDEPKPVAKPEPKPQPKPAAATNTARNQPVADRTEAVAKTEPKVSEPKPEPVKPKPEPKPEPAPTRVAENTFADEPIDLPEASGLVDYTLVVRDEDGNFIPGSRVTFNWDGKSKTVRSNSRGIASVKLPAKKRVSFDVQGSAGLFKDAYRVNFTLRKREFPISFKVRINEAETTEGSILISQEGTRFKKVTQPGKTENLLEGTYFFTYQSKTLSHSETYTVTRRNRFVFDISTDPNVYYRDLFLKKNQEALAAAVQKVSDPTKGYEFFMPRYWLAQYHIDEGDWAASNELLGQLFSHANQWERMAIKPNYVLDYLRCLSAIDKPDYLMIARICRNQDVVKQFNTLSTGRKESNWKFLFYYYRITAFYELSEERTGPQKRSMVKQTLKTYNWLDDIQAEVLNSNPDKYGRLREIQQKLETQTTN
ncbi:protein kinase domain-containing protein [Acanthopleuribacter pedis]|uniref:Protein kinase n=1 Tax=Acanthopleuribacter pedis TaxID=442870 RepID=A0A8J7U136_9BACT|nr:protein kinase [Acanthopleuribacter pedis]MBO1317132.1 protein kinase [Acanthopleuribacter pedis]